MTSKEASDLCVEHPPVPAPEDHPDEQLCEFVEPLEDAVVAGAGAVQAATALGDER